MPKPDDGRFIRGSTVGFGPLAQQPVGSVPFRILAVGDFGGAAAGGDGPGPDGPELIGITVRGDVPSSLPGELGAHIAGQVDNLLGSTPHLPVSLHIGQWRDFGAKSLLAKVDALRRATALRDGVAAGRPGGEAPPELDRLRAVLLPPAAPGPVPAPAPRGGDDDEVDRLLAMFDGGPSAPRRADTLDPVVNALVAGARGAAPAGPSLKGRVAAADALIAAQVSAIREMPRFRAVEAAWRGVQLLTRRPGWAADVTLDLVHVPDAAAAATLLRDLVPDELGQREGGRPLACVLMTGAAAPDDDGLRDLGLCAAAGAALRVPVLASLREDFTGHPHCVAFLDALRGGDGAGWLALCAGDVVLDSVDRAVPLWGAPAWAVAALAVAALAAGGDPRGVGVPDAATLTGLDLHEVAGRGGTAAWPLRRAPSAAPPGVISFGAAPNRDRLWLRTAATLDGSALGDRLAAAWHGAPG